MIIRIFIGLFIFTAFFATGLPCSMAGDLDDGIPISDGIPVDNDLKTKVNTSYIKSKVYAVEYQIKKQSEGEWTQYSGSDGENVCINCTFIDGNGNDVYIENETEGDILVK